MGVGELGVPVRLLDSGGEDVGVVHMPPPVACGDLAALEQGFPLRVVGVIELEVGGAVDILAEVEVAPLCLSHSRR